MFMEVLVEGGADVPAVREILERRFQLKKDINDLLKRRDHYYTPSAATGSVPARLLLLSRGNIYYQNSPHFCCLLQSRKQHLLLRKDLLRLSGPNQSGSLPIPSSAS